MSRRELARRSGLNIKAQRTPHTAARYPARYRAAGAATLAEATQSLPACCCALPERHRPRHRERIRPCHDRRSPVHSLTAPSGSRGRLHPPYHVATVVNHPDDRWGLGSERAPSPLAFEPSAPFLRPCLAT